LKDGRNEITNEYEMESRDLITYDYFSQSDSSFSYHFYQSSIFQFTNGSEAKTKKSKEENLLLRWQNETNGAQRINLLAEWRKTVSDLAGQVLDTNYLELLGLLLSALA